MTARWPIHPRPIPGEALTSWLHRIADGYGITVDDLAFDIGYSSTAIRISTWPHRRG